MQDLAVLTPSLLVCALFVWGVVALLRHEMAPKRRNREDDSGAEDMSARGEISSQEETAATTTSDHEEAVHRQTGKPPAGKPQTGSRSPG